MNGRMAIRRRDRLLRITGRLVGSGSTIGSMGDPGSANCQATSV